MEGEDKAMRKKEERRDEMRERVKWLVEDWEWQASSKEKLWLGGKEQGVKLEVTGRWLSR